MLNKLKCISKLIITLTLQFKDNSILVAVSIFAGLSDTILEVVHPNTIIAFLIFIQINSFWEDVNMIFRSAYSVYIGRTKMSGTNPEDHAEQLIVIEQHFKFESILTYNTAVMPSQKTIFWITLAILNGARNSRTQLLRWTTQGAQQPGLV